MSVLREGWFRAGPVVHRKRFLLVAYNFPPDIAVGALRWQKLARYACERGWGVDVITLHPDELPLRDDAALANLPEDTRAFGVRHAADPVWRLHRAMIGGLRNFKSRRSDSGGESLASAKGPAAGSASLRWAVRNWVRGEYSAFVEYAHYRRWAHDAADAARRVFDPRLHRAIVTSGPPHMAHEAGRLISLHTGLPLIVDLRDPWSGIERLDAIGPTWYRLARHFERRVVRRARLIITTTKPAATLLADSYPSFADRVITVTNGYDDDEPSAAWAGSSRFTIAFAGSIYLDRSPKTLFEAASRVVKDLGLRPEDFGIEFMGDVSHFAGTPLTTMASDHGIERFVRLHAPRPRREAHKFLASAAMLVSLPQDSHMAIPAKIFEYMRFPAWLLVLAEPDSATGRLLSSTSADLVMPSDVDGIAAAVRRRISEFRAGTRPTPIAVEGPFSRREQAAILFDALEEAIEPIT